MRWQVFKIYRLTVQIFGVVRIRMSFRNEKLSYEESLMRTESFLFVAEAGNRIDGDWLTLKNGTHQFPHFLWEELSKRKQLLQSSSDQRFVGRD